jgi:hypothetical protein
MEPSTTETWVARVAEWKASGERAETFSRRGGYAASTLRWWASKLKRDMTTSATAPAATPPAVTLARVVRTPAAEAAPEVPSRAIVLEVVDAGVRIAIEPGADPTTLAMVLGVLRECGGRA